MSRELPARIVILTDDLGGGTGNHVLSMIRHWDRERWDVEILSRAPLTSRLTPNVPVEYIPAENGVNVYPFAQIKAYRRMRGEVLKRRPSIVHAYFFWPILFARILKLRGAIGTLLENREDQGFAWGRHEYSLLRLTRAAPDRIVCVSDAVRQVVLEREGLPESRITVIRNGVGELPDGVAEGAGVRKEFGFSEEHLVVGMVANFNRSVKGVSVLLDAIPEIVRSVPSARFLLLGRGKEEEALRDQARRLGIGPYVVFAGFRRDIHRCYGIMDVSALTSFSEGLSITLLESMQCGIPVVATAVGGNPELVVDGRTGYLVPSGDPGAVAERTIRLLQDRELRRNMGEEARRRVARDFGIRDVASRYLDLYDGMLCGSEGRGRV